MSHYEDPKNVFICSALTGLNIHTILQHIKYIYIKKLNNGEIKKNREEQELFWYKKNIKNEIINLFLKKTKIDDTISNLSLPKNKSPRRQALSIIKKIFKEDEK